jgi:glycosyltransferase involved in cell wall biosynthesis
VHQRIKKLKVLVIWRGPSPYRVDFFNELGKYCDLTVLFEMKPGDISDKKLDWFHEDYKNFNGIYLKGILLFGKIWFCFDLIKYLIPKKKYDFIVLGMYSTPTQIMAILYFKLVGIPYVLNSDGGFIKKDRKIVHYVKRFLIRGAKAYLSSSVGTTNYLRHYGAKGNITIYPFTSQFKNQVLKSIDPSIKTKKKQELGIEEEVMIMFSGQFIDRKGIDVLLTSCNGLSKNCSVYIIGGKPTNQYLKIVYELNLENIHFIDFKKPEELVDFYLAADIYVLPTREDIWGLVINEAMAYGLPIVTTDHCLAGKELIEDFTNGFIVPTNNPEELRLRLNILIQDKKLRVLMGENNKLKIENYTIESMAKKHFDFFKFLHGAESMQ